MPISRRAALTGLAAAGLLPGIAVARVAGRQGGRFVLVILRGAMDGLSAVAPLADPDYATLRGDLAIGTPADPKGALPLDGRFWLHAALAPLMPFYARGEMVIVHAMASPYRERSHFDGQTMIETGLVRPVVATPVRGGPGWLNRAIGAMGGEGIRGIAFTPAMPLVLQGAAPASNWQPGPAVANLQEAVLRMYEQDPALRRAYAEAIATRELVDSAGKSVPQGRDFRSLAGIAGSTLAEDGGPNVAVLDIGGWDTHVGQGTAKGRLAGALGQLAAGLEAMHHALGPAWNDTVVVAVTEFGRTARQNGTGGTDHGTATAGFALGGAVAGGRVITDWPGLSMGALYEQRDLAPTTDLRSFLKALLGDHLGVSAAVLESQVFPQSAAARPLAGLVRS